MAKTFTFVTSQYSCDRIIYAARKAADQTGSELIVVGILDSEYELNPQAIDYLFTLSKKNKAVMRLFFSEDKIAVMDEMILQHDCRYIVTGMPSNADSVLYKLWKKYPKKSFFTVDPKGELVEVAPNMQYCTA